MRFLNTTNGYAFRRIFGSEQHQEVLISFLNSVLNLSDEHEIVAVQRADPYQVPRLKYLEETELDIQATCKSGRQFIVEILVEPFRSYYQRDRYYNSQAYTEQPIGAANCFELKPVYVIGVLKFVALDNYKYLSRRLLLDAKTYGSHSQDFEFCLIEPPKFAKGVNELQSITDKWMFFLRYLSLQKDPELIFANDTTLLQALELAYYYKLNDTELHIYEALERRRMNDAETARTYGINKEEEARAKRRAEARAEGRVEGEQIGMQKAVRSMAEKGYSSDAIADALQLDIALVLELLKD